MAKWAIGIRSGEKESAIDDAINSGKILRTHLLRPTWHFIAAEDIHWMLELTAPQVRIPLNSGLRKLGLDAKMLSKATTIIEKSLSNNQYLTRAEIMLELDKHNIPVDYLKPSHIMMHAELERLVCNGPMRGKQFTYALLEERAGKSAKFSKEKALQSLAMRYFTSHGPATLADFGWWSGLSVTNSRMALDLVKDKLESAGIDNQVYWFNGEILKKSNKKSIHLLPAFDEFLISYKDRTAAIDLSHQPKAFTRNGIFSPVILINGKAEGTWKRTFSKNKLVLEFRPFLKFDEKVMEQIKTEAEKYAGFMGQEPKIRL
jgi:winged helix DNA-binding protein